jgi:OmpA-OmpF porin, OOP family
MRFRRIVQVLVCLSACSVSAAAMAQTYIGGELGGSEVKEFCSRTADSCDEKGSPWRLFGGTYLTPNFGIEAGFIDLGHANASDRVSDTDTKLQARAGEVLSMFTYRARQASIFAKVGGYYALTTLTVITGGQTTKRRENNAGLVYGAGAQINFTPNFGVRGDWHRYAKVGGSPTGGDTDINTFFVGLIWNFR